MTPDWWNALHGDALASLSPEWRPAGVSIDGATGFHALEDLRACGLAEERRTPTHIRNGIAHGEHIEFRRTS